MNDHQVSGALALRASRTSPVRVDNRDHALARELTKAVRGEVRFDAGARALYARDASNFRVVPIGVVTPKDDDDVLAALSVCRERSVPVLARGGGTSLAGQCCNSAVVLDCSKYMNRVLEIDSSAQLARVQPGTILDDLRERAEREGLTFGPDPATHDHCTLGGMLGNDSCGVHAVMAEFYGPGARVQDNVESLDVVTYDGCRFEAGATTEDELQRIIAKGERRGQVYKALRDIRDRYADEIRAKYPNIPRRVSGYSLPSLLPENGFHVGRALVGSEGTCVTILGATLKLIRAQPERATLVLGYEDAPAAGDAIPAVRALERKPVGCEGLDRALLENVRMKEGRHRYGSLLPRGDAWLVVEFGGATPEEATDAARQAQAQLSAAAVDSVLLDAKEKAEAVWQLRESGLGATAFVPGKADTWPGWEDSAVPPDRIGPYLRDLRALLATFGYEACLYGHFAQGCVHTRIPFDLRSAQGIEEYKHFTRLAAELVVSHGGSLSGEHGDGQQRGDLLPLMFGERLMQALREFKAAFDPNGKMNPNKLVDAAPRTDDLTLGAGYHVAVPETHFSFGQDRSDMEQATLRCVGVGACRRTKPDGVMCPSFMVLREEMHSTRGRAHLLHEMLRGEVITEGFDSHEVKEALDLCLSCKGCTHECPVNVDIPTLKAEFLSHHYETNSRPRQAYALGWIHRWSRLASLLPGVANLFTQTPGLSALAKKIAGVHPERALPRFAPRTFRNWFRERIAPSTEGRRVLLWPDTFNDHFHPETLAAATRALEHAGCHVVIPKRPLCCGRPLYDFGMLDRAKATWETTLDSLAGEIEAGTPLVGVEPSCLAAFRDELISLLPNDPRARQLKEQTYSLAGFLASVPSYRPPSLKGKRALVHFHCHQRAALGVDSEKSLLGELGLAFEVPQETCCGMAGAFGFEAKHHSVSLAIGELSLLPAVRDTSENTLVIADGFSCRMQIEQGTGRRPVHTAQLLGHFSGD